MPCQEQAPEEVTAVVQERSHLQQRENISALLNTVTQPCAEHRGSLLRRVPPSALGKGLAVTGVHGQGETEAQTGNFPTPEPVSTKEPTFQARARAPKHWPCLNVTSPIS